MNTGVVTAFIPLPVKHLTSGQYHDLAVDLVAGADDAGAKVMTFMDDKLGDLWAYNLCTGRQPDTPVPPDRYPSAEVNIMSHIVQHTAPRGLCVLPSPIRRSTGGCGLTTAS